MSSYQYRDHHVKDKTVSPKSYIQHENPHTWERRFFIHIQRKPITTFFTEYSWCYYDRQFAGQYLYTLNVTRSGRPCVAWWDYAQAIPSVIPLHILSPSNRMYDDAFYPDGSIRDARNYCRNPETAPFQIWCYIAVALASWELCSPEECPNLGWYLYNMA